MTGLVTINKTKQNNPKKQQQQQQKTPAHQLQKLAYWKHHESCGTLESELHILWMTGLQKTKTKKILKSQSFIPSELHF